MLILLALAVFLGYFIGIRRERGRQQLLASLNEVARDERRSRGGVKLKTVQFRR